MIPILFDKNATTFNNYGIGVLSDAISCIVTEERNGKFELEMEYPTVGRLFSDIVESKIILAKPNETQNNQAFRIYKITSPMNGKVKVLAEHISYQLNYIPVGPITGVSCADAMSKIVGASITTNPFTFTTDKNVATVFTTGAPRSCRSLLGGTEGSLLEQYKGEYLWDNYNVSLLVNRGQDRGVTLRYGKNITGFEEDVDLSDTVTGIYPYWKNETDMVVGDISEVSASDFAYRRIEVADVSSDITLAEGQTVPTKAQVTAAGLEKLNNKSYIAVANTNIEVSFIALWQTDEYKDIAPLEQVGLCDTVNVIYEPLNISVQKKVIKTEYNVLLDRYNEIELGDTSSNLVSSVAASITTTSKNVSRIEKLDDRITLEVARAEGEETRLASQITMMAEEIKSTVSKTQKEWDTTGYNVTLYGYGTPTEAGYSASDYSGRYYLDQVTGYIYYSNGTTWSKVHECVSIQTSLSSQIIQTAEQIESTVAGAQKEWDTGNYNISAYGYGTPGDTGHDPSDYSGQYYLDNVTGFIYLSNGTTWTKTAEAQSVTAALSSRISQTATGISFTLSKSGEDTAVLSMTYTKEDGTTITLAAQQIQFTGLVEFTDLSTSGSTIINGANITTGDIYCHNDSTNYFTRISTSTGKLTWVMEGSELDPDGVLTLRFKGRTSAGQQADEYYDALVLSTTQMEGEYSYGAALNAPPGADFVSFGHRDNDQNPWVSSLILNFGYDPEIMGRTFDENVLVFGDLSIISTSLGHASFDIANITWEDVRGNEHNEVSLNIDLYGDNLYVNGFPVLTRQSPVDMIVASRAGGKPFAIYFMGTYGDYENEDNEDIVMNKCTYACTVLEAYYLAGSPSSDRRIKHDIAELSDKMISLYEKLSPVSFKFDDDVAMDVKAHKGKTRFGFIAQDVKALLDDNGIDCDLAFQEDGKVPSGAINEKCPDGLYRINYDDFHAMHIQYAHYLNDRVSQLEAENIELKKRIAKIEEVLFK